MNVYIANFGRGNTSWPDCLKRSTIAVLDGLTVHPHWQRGDREGYIAEAQRVYKSREGRAVIKPVASRWFNLNDVIRGTSGDIWIHREKDQLWWTISTGDAIQAEIIEDPLPVGGFETVNIFHKRCQPWQDQNKNGTRLHWKAIHAKAREFLFTEGTFQRLSPDNALYAQALLNGDSLESWHTRPNWQAKVQQTGKGAVTVFNDLQITAARMLEELSLTAERMAKTAFATALQSGKTVTTQTKTKEFSFSERRELEPHIIELYKSQEGLCALTGLEMILDFVDADRELRCSLDRIDSSGHYARGNLQVVCKFANRWKNASDNDEFKRLIELVRKSPDLEH
jgi:hypothetical protein